MSVIQSFQNQEDNIIVLDDSSVEELQNLLMNYGKFIDECDQYIPGKYVCYEGSIVRIKENKINLFSSLKRNLFPPKVFGDLVERAVQRSFIVASKYDLDILSPVVLSYWEEKVVSFSSFEKCNPTRWYPVSWDVSSYLELLLIMLRTKEGKDLLSFLKVFPIPLWCFQKSGLDSVVVEELDGFVYDIVCYDYSGLEYLINRFLEAEV